MNLQVLEIAWETVSFFLSEAKQQTQRGPAHLCSMCIVVIGVPQRRRPLVLSLNGFSARLAVTGIMEVGGMALGKCSFPQLYIYNDHKQLPFSCFLQFHDVPWLCSRSERTHFDNLYSVSSISPMGRMAKNRKVEKSAETVWLNMVSNRTRKTRLQSCASLRSAAERNLFVGEHREEEPWNQRTAAGWTSGVSVLKAGTSVPRPELISVPPQKPLRWTVTSVG